MQIEKKRKTRLIQLSGECPLSWHERVVWSALARLERHNRGATYKKLGELTTVDAPHTIPKVIKRLVSLGMVKKEGRYWRALPAPVEWQLPPIGKSGAHWSKRLPYWWLYLPAAGLSLNQAATWSVMYSYQKKDKSIRLSGIVSQTRISERTVKRAVAKLRALALLDEELTVLEPNDDNHRLFQDRKMRTAASWSLIKAYELKEDGTAFMNAKIASVTQAEEQMRENGWSTQDIAGWMRSVRGVHNILLDRLLITLSLLYQHTQATHEKNQAKGKFPFLPNCKGLFIRWTQNFLRTERTKIKSMHLPGQIDVYRYASARLPKNFKEGN
jgi:hypothetical protein